LKEVRGQKKLREKNGEPKKTVPVERGKVKTRTGQEIKLCERWTQHPVTFEPVTVATKDPWVSSITLRRWKHWRGVMEFSNVEGAGKKESPGKKPEAKPVTGPREVRKMFVGPQEL